MLVHVAALCANKWRGCVYGPGGGPAFRYLAAALLSSITASWWLAASRELCSAKHTAASVDSILCYVNDDA